ncbi:MAG: hypothetical protein EOP48_05880 [Sphingobacteriales bacterium]|nr:MAG: hypothetical protein EOP48_05880 [Sphingobacteriales bacterium]
MKIIKNTCSKACQKSDWLGHKDLCREVSRDIKNNARESVSRPDVDYDMATRDDCNVCFVPC